MELIKLAHPSQVRSVPDSDLDRYLSQGWCEIKKPVNRNARKQRDFRKRRKLIGYKRFTAYLPLDVFDELAAAKLAGEDNSELLFRLLQLLRTSALKGQ